MMNKYSKICAILTMTITFCLIVSTQGFFQSNLSPTENGGIQQGQSSKKKVINLDAVTSGSAFLDNFDFGVSQLGGFMDDLAEDLTPTVWSPVNNRFQDINSMTQPLPRVNSELEEHDSFYKITCKLINVPSKNDVKIDLSSTDYFHIRVPYGIISTTTTMDNNSFKHTVKLPKNINRNEITAKFLTDSTLEVTLPKYTDIKIEISA